MTYPDVSAHERLRPLFRWAGSKRQMVPTLASYWHEAYGRYVEPFAGSACLFFRIRPLVAILGDINTELIHAYATVRDFPDDVGRALAKMPQTAEVYYRIRSQTPTNLDPTARAARFVYLNRFCFNGLYRTNGDGVFNVPYGGERSGTIPTVGELRQYAAALRGVSLRASDFVDTLKVLAPSDFVYLDPPYAVRSQWRRGLHYTEDAFAVDDVVRLRAAIERIHDIGANFLLSYAESDEGRRLAHGFFCRTIEVRRSIAGSTFKRVRANELLISNRKQSES